MQKRSRELKRNPFTSVENHCKKDAFLPSTSSPSLGILYTIRNHVDSEVLKGYAQMDLAAHFIPLPHTGHTCPSPGFLGHYCSAEGPARSETAQQVNSSQGSTSGGGRVRVEQHPCSCTLFSVHPLTTGSVSRKILTLATVVV